jgi:hypothetical protein
VAWIPNVNPSELIESQWGNTIRDHVVNTFASSAERDAAIPAPVAGMLVWIASDGLLYEYRNAKWRPPIGTVLAVSVAIIPDINTSTLGIYDLVGISQGVTRPYDTMTYANVAFYGGFGNGFTNFNVDIAPYGGAAITASPSPIQAVASAWASASLASVWGNLPGSDIGYKARATFVQGVNMHTAGFITIQNVVHV